MQTIKSILFVTVAPVVLVLCFFTNVISESKVSRSPAIHFSYVKAFK